MPGKTNDEMLDALSTLVVDLAEGRMLRWQEGDKRGEFHSMDDIADLLKAVHRLKEDEIEDLAACGVGFIC